MSSQCQKMPFLSYFQGSCVLCYAVLVFSVHMHVLVNQVKIVKTPSNEREVSSSCTRWPQPGLFMPSPPLPPHERESERSRSRPKSKPNLPPRGGETFDPDAPWKRRSLLEEGHPALGKCEHPQPTPGMAVPGIPSISPPLHPPGVGSP